MAINHPDKTPKLLILLLITISIFLLLHPLSAEPTTNHHLRPRLTAESHCDGTRHPALCVSTLATLHDLHKMSLSDVISATISAAVKEVEASQSKCTDLKYRRVGTLRQRHAIDDCIQMLDDSADELRDAVAELKEANGAISGRKYDDIGTLLSAAMTNQYTCLDGFQFGDGEKLPDDTLKPQLTRTSQHVSNALAMITKVAHKSAAAAKKLPTEEHIVYSVREDGLPRWLTKTDEKLLAAAVNEMKYDLVVAKDGTGKFTTVGEAVAAAPSNSKTRFVIYIKAGVYKENVDVDRKKTMLMFVGDGIGKTVITSNRNAADGSTTFSSATVAVVGNGFIAKGISFENTAGPSKGQAVAFRSSADLSAFYQCSFAGYQDTLYPHSGRQFYRNCDVSGTVDFIFGNSAAVFQECNLYARRPNPGQVDVYTAQGRKDPNEKTGFSFINCKLGAAPDLAANRGSVKTYLGRPWKEYSRTVFLLSDIGDLVDPAGWLEWSGNFALDTLYYGEYSNRGAGSNTSRRVKWRGYRVIETSKEADEFTVKNLINGEEWVKATGIPYYPNLKP